MKMNFNYFLIFVIGINYAATIRGKVNDIDSNENLIGATAVLINTKIGASTDVDGNFIIKNIVTCPYCSKKTKIINYQCNYVNKNLNTCCKFTLNESKICNQHINLLILKKKKNLEKINKFNKKFNTK